MSWSDDDVVSSKPAQAWSDEDVAEPATNTLGQEAKRQGGLLVRALASGAGNIGAIPADILGKAVNAVAGSEVVPNQQRALQQTLTRFGLPEPERGIERFTQGVAETAPAMALPAAPLAQIGGNAVLGAAQSKAGEELQGAAFGGAAGALPSLLAGALRSGGRGAANVLGMTTGTGSESVKQAYRNAPGFVENMRGNVEPAAVVEQARNGVQNMRQQMYDAYATAKGGWAGDKTPLDTTPIAQAFDAANKRFSFEGTPQPGVEGVQQQVSQVLEHWQTQAQKNPAFVSVEGLDALKRHLQDLTPDFNNRTGRAYVTEVVNSVKSTITEQAPQYATAMKDYWQRSNQLDEITKSLSLGDKATVDTALRKLQSLMRNNVNANYGQRLNSANVLAEQGGQDVLPAVAGQSMNSVTPRGLQATVASGGGLAALLTNPAALAALPAFSPRLVGEGVRGAGMLDTPAVRRTLEMLRRSTPAALRGRNRDE